MLLIMTKSSGTRRQSLKARKLIYHGLLMNIVAIL